MPLSFHAALSPLRARKTVPQAIYVSLSFHVAVKLLRVPVSSPESELREHVSVFTWLQALYAPVSGPSSHLRVFKLSRGSISPLRARKPVPNAGYVSVVYVALSF